MVAIHKDYLKHLIQRLLHRKVDNKFIYLDEGCLDGNGKIDEDFCSALENNHTVSAVYIDNYLLQRCFKNEQLDLIMKLLFSLPNLHYINANFSREATVVRRAISLHFANALGANNKLTKLQLQINGLDWNIFMTNVMQVNKTLKALDLSNCTLSLPDFQAISYALEKPNNMSLTNLKLMRNALEYSHCILLSYTLTVNTSLTGLKLCSNGVGDLGCQVLSNALTTNSFLTHLDLTDNKIGDEGCKALAIGLANNTGITTLILSENNIGDEGCMAIAGALQKNSTLTTLHLNLNNNIGHDGLQAFLGVLYINNSTLRQLRITVEVEDKICNALLSKIEFYLKLNRVGRASLLMNKVYYEGDSSVDTTREQWVSVLNKVQNDIACLFYFLSINPELVL